MTRLRTIASLVLCYLSLLTAPDLAQTVPISNIPVVMQAPTQAQIDAVQNARLDAIEKKIGIAPVAAPPAPTAPPASAPTSFVLGVNYPWNIVGSTQDYGVDFGTGLWGTLSNFAKVDTDFAAMSAQGVTVARWWLFADGRYNPKFDSTGKVTGFDASFAGDVDHALSIANLHHVKILFVLADNTLFGWPGSSQPVTWGGHSAIITDPATRLSYINNAVTPFCAILSKSAYRSSVYAIEVENEPENAINSPGRWGNNAHLNLADMQSFVKDNIAAIHAAGFLGTVGSGDPRWVSDYVGCNLDFYESHYYPWQDQAFGTKDASGKAVPLSGLLPVSGMGVDKPVLLGECPSAGQTRAIIDAADKDGYFGALFWAYNKVDAWCDWTTFAPILKAWTPPAPNAPVVTPPVVVTPPASAPPVITPPTVVPPTPNTGGTPAAAMPFLVTPVYVSANQYNKALTVGTATSETTWRSYSVPSAQSPDWIAFDVSQAHASSILLRWANGTYFYNHLWYGGGAAYGIAQDYTIEGNSAAGGTLPTTGWTTLATVVGNHFHSRAHVLNTTGVNWLRIRVTAVDGTTYNQDTAFSAVGLWDASAGLNDTWAIVGDSITANSMNPTGFAAAVHAADPHRWPEQQGAGIPGSHTWDWIGVGGWIDQVLAISPEHNVGISLGTNDYYGGVGSGTEQGYYANLTEIVHKILAAGKVPYLSTLIGSHTAGIQASGVSANRVIARVLAENPACKAGPDFWTFFNANPELFDDPANNVHPNNSGNDAIRRAWAQIALTGNPTLAGTGWSPPVAAAQSPYFQIHAGSGTVGTFAPDTYLASGGGLYTTSAAIDVSAPHAASAQVYQTERNGTFAYALKGLKPATAYTLRLHFAEIYYTAAGKRLLNVSVNGTVALTAYDVFAQAGGANKAIVADVPVTSDASGQLSVSFAPAPGSPDTNAKISAIEVL